MKKKILLALSIVPATAWCAEPTKISSPKGELEITLNTNFDTIAPASFSLGAGDIPLLDNVRLGISTALRDFDQLKCVYAGPESTATERYTMKTGKRSHISKAYNSRTYKFTNAANDTLTVDFRLFPDGLAFRYAIPGAQPGECISEELTAYEIPDGTPRWFQPYDISYERFYPYATNGQCTEQNPNHQWGYPALACPAQDKYILITESDLKRGQAASSLKNADDEATYQVIYGDGAQELTADGWTSPWRVVIAGDLSDIVESTLVTDVASPAVTDHTDWIAPAPVSWIYWAYNHGSNDLDIIKKYIDLAVDMHWPYMLIDAEWDEMKGGHSVEEAFGYANSLGIKPMIWYNSSIGWINGAPGPKFRLNDRDKRLKEFEWLRQHGVAGLKIDFFGGDRVLDTDLGIDLLEDALDYGMAVTYHGATVPRGWQRTYPNLMTVEGVYGAEWYNNNGYLTDRAAKHNATLPFTRNVIGPMDYTPGTFSDSQHPHITSHGHELALTVLFESPMQHMPDRPEAYASLPDEVKQLLRSLPTTWDDTRLLSGYPGHHAVLARRKGADWYIAGINGTDEPMTLTANLDKLGLYDSNITIYADGETQREFAPADRHRLVDSTLSVPCLPRGGFVAVITGIDANDEASNPFGNALVPDMIADASIQQIGDWFYCYATTDGYGRGLETSGPPVVWKSRDFVHWTMEGTYFPSAKDQKYWAPSKAVKANGKYYIYPTINGYMYAGVADSPDGPFKLARGNDAFSLPYTSSTLLQTEDPRGIDAEVFIDDDGHAYVFWGQRHVARLAPDMITVSEDIQQIDTPHKALYSEGPIFFKRNGIYYYLYNPQNETCDALRTKRAKIKTKRFSFSKRSVPLRRFSGHPLFKKKSTRLRRDLSASRLSI